jgi:hypothetical protein
VDKEETKEIRDRIIKAAHDGKIDIPPISRVNIEIIDPAGIPRTVDDQLLEMIENGEEGLTDDLFFQLLSDNPKYLMYGPFQEKIAAWQAVVRDALWDRDAENEERLKAQDNLKKIGTTLSIKRPDDVKKVGDTWIKTIGSGRTKESLEFRMFLELMQLYQRLKKIMTEIRRHTYYRNIYVEQNCPDLKDYVELILKKRRPLGCAKAIIIKKYNVGERTLDGIIKNNLDAICRRRRLTEKLTIPKLAVLLDQSSPTSKKYQP